MMYSFFNSIAIFWQISASPSPWKRFLWYGVARFILGHNLWMAATQKVNSRSHSNLKPAAVYHLNRARRNVEEVSPMSKSLENKRIMVVDDDADTRGILRVALEEAGATVVSAHSVDAAFETYRQSPPHAVI